jgi:hypothetical protein
VSKLAKILNRLLYGNADNNLRFDDLRNLLLHFGFSEHVRGSHHIFTLAGIEEIINLQPRGAMAKPYQVKQVRRLIVANGLAISLESEQESNHLDNDTTPEEDSDAE